MNWNPESYNRNARFVSELGLPVVELLQPRANERILDLGCGDGELTKKLKQFGCTVLGVDASPEMIAAARSNGVDAQCIDGHELSFDCEFDAVFSNAALHWMRQPDLVIAGVWRALKRPGRFVGELGGIGNVSRLHEAMCQMLTEQGIAPESVDPWYFPSPSEYQQKLESARFEVNQIELIDRLTPLPTGLGGWIESVAHPFLKMIKPSAQQDFVKEIENRVRPYLQDDNGVWSADYVRLRFLALKPA